MLINHPTKQAVWFSVLSLSFLEYGSLSKFIGNHFEVIWNSSWDGHHLNLIFAESLYSIEKFY